MQEGEGDQQMVRKVIVTAAALRVTQAGVSDLVLSSNVSTLSRIVRTVLLAKPKAWEI
jgi:hypothetical protein